MLDTIAIRGYRRRTAVRFARRARGVMDMRDPNVAIATVVDLVAKAKGDAESLALRIRTEQKAKGYALDVRADYAEGSAAAYAYALSIIAGAYGVATVDELTYAPVEPDTLLDPGNFAPQWPVDHAEGE